MKNISLCINKPECFNSYENKYIFNYKCCNKKFTMFNGMKNDFICQCNFNSLLHLTKNKNECCVCLEQTNFKTKCNHSLCYIA